MTIEARIIAHGETHAALALEMTQTSAHQIAAAAELIVQAQLSEGKLLGCGDKDTMALVQYFIARMINQHEIERPGLAALALNIDTAILDCFTHDGDIQQLYAKQIMALGKEGDILFIIAGHSDTGYLQNAIAVAHECGMHVILLSGDSEELIEDRCIHITVPDHNISRVNEMHLLTVHCLCDAIDYTLLGAN